MDAPLQERLLNDIDDRALIEIGRTLRGGTFGKDPARMNKAQKVEHIMTLGDAGQIESAIESVTNGKTMTPKTNGKAHIETPNLLETIDDTDKEEALEKALDFIRDIARRPTHIVQEAELDEERVAEIVGEIVSPVMLSVDERIANNATETQNVNLALGRVESTLREVGEKVEALAAIKALPPVISIEIGEQVSEVDTAGKHPIFPLVLALCMLPRKYRPQVMLVGPAGSGKSTLAHHIADALDRPFAAISLSPGVTEAALTARILPIHEGGRFGSVDSAFLNLYQKPSVVLLDEMDAADPSVLVAANAAIGNGGFTVEARAVDNRETWVVRDELNVILGAMNTMGTGANAMYAGRGAQDGAVLDRYLFIEVAPNRALNARIMGIESEGEQRWQPSAKSQEPEAIAEDLRELHTWLDDIEQQVAKRGLKRLVTTRARQKAVALRLVGCSVPEIQDRLLMGWKDDEKAAIGYESRPWVTKDSFTTDELLSSDEDLLSSVVTDSDPWHNVKCPKCEASMIKRTAQKGPRAGSEFYGCTNYPTCKGTRNIY